MKLKCTLVIANEKNMNDRVYSTSVLNDMVKQFKKNKPMFGEIGMRSESFTSLSHASHKINSIEVKKQRLPRKIKKHLKKQGFYKKWRNKKNHILIGEIELLNTPQGELTKKMIENKTAVVRPRGIGNVINGRIQDYSLISFDVINKDEDAFKDLI